MKKIKIILIIVIVAIISSTCLNSVFAEESRNNLSPPLLISQTDTSGKGLPIRDTIGGSWGGAQTFNISNNAWPVWYTHLELYVRKIGDPDFDLIVEIREESIDGELVDSVTIPKENIDTEFQWLEIDCENFGGEQYETFVIKIAPPLNQNNSDGYEWSYTYGNPLQRGSFLFTRDSGNLWHDRSEEFEFTFKVYGYAGAPS
jgi:hypothetical protein